MFPNLVGDDELPSEKDIFPVIEKHLFVGGPRHAQEFEVPTDEHQVKVFGMPQRQPMVASNQGILLSQPLVPEATSYTRRTLSAESADGGQYTRDVFVHDEIPNGQIAEHLLVQALLVNFVRGGQEVVEHDDGPAKQA